MLDLILRKQIENSPGSVEWIHEGTKMKNSPNDLHLFDAMSQDNVYP